MSITHTERYTYEQRVAQAADRLITMQQCGVGRYNMNLQSIAMVFCVKEADIVNAASILRDQIK
jgi:hypothetical protein